MATLLPSLTLHIHPGQRYAPSQFFDNASRGQFTSYDLEIGFGCGEHLAVRAYQNPEVGFIGCEAFVNGIASLLEKIRAYDLQNIRVYPNPVQDLLPALADQSVHRVFILFPDPWPKSRHHKRRLITGSFLKMVSRILVPEGLIYLASDDKNYINAMQEAIQQTPELRLISHTHKRPDDWPPTRYEQKAIQQGKICHYLISCHVTK